MFSRQNFPKKCLLVCENLTWSNYVRNQVLPVLWKCSKMHFLSLIFDMERGTLERKWIRNNLEFMEWTIQNCPQMLFYVTSRHFYRPLKSCDIRFGMEEVQTIQLHCECKKCSIMLEKVHRALHRWCGECFVWRCII